MAGDQLGIADPLAWMKEHGNIAGMPVECKSNPGHQHPLVKFTRKRYDAQMSVFKSFKKSKTFRVSPDVFHSLVGNRQSASTLGHTLVCDESLTADTILPTDA